MIKNISVAVGPDAPGQVAPAGSTWKYSVQVVARKGEAINVPTTSYSSYGTWSAPRITGKAPSGVSTLGDIYTVEATFTSKVAMNQSHCAPTFGWLNSSRPLRPESTILVQAVSPGGAVNAKIVAG
ncbi:MAG: hypothetical protein Q4G35_10195, partial [Propionibacteriaceae bacterium]|nr:hypothetical protein [Propionibacteriaceae bacterium]